MVVQAAPRNRLLSETLVAIVKSPSLFPAPAAEKLIHSTTVMRYVRRGVKIEGGRTLKLECVRVGGKLFTSEQAVQRFIDAQNQPADVA